MSRLTFKSLALHASASALAVAGLALAATAHAENAPDPGQPVAGLSEIIVTAQKREENLQKTPISISVMKSADLANRHIQSLLDLQDGSIPSLRVLPFSGRNFSLVLNIRGVGVLGDSNQPARDAGVGVYIDGVYLGRPQGLNGALYDLESVEVLKGPQGTLFGRNTEGGALNITTKKPTGKFGLSVTGGFGNYGSYESELHLDLPAYHDISVKVDGMITSRGGTVRNPMSGQSDFNAFNRRGLRAQVQWKPITGFSHAGRHRLCARRRVAAQARRRRRLRRAAPAEPRPPARPHADAEVGRDAVGHAEVDLVVPRTDPDPVGRWWHERRQLCDHRRPHRRCRA